MTICRSRFRFHFRLALNILCAVLLAALNVKPERLPLKSYTTSDGLAHNIINKIVKDSRGFLWFCTFEGLSRFDGYAFTNYGVDDGLPSPVVNDLLETREGEYWVATDGGLVRFNPNGIPRRHTESLGSDNPQSLTASRTPENSISMFTTYVPAADENLGMGLEPTDARRSHW